MEHLERLERFELPYRGVAVRCITRLCYKRIEITVEIYLNGDVSSTTVILSGYWDLNPGNLFCKQAH